LQAERVEHAAALAELRNHYEAQLDKYRLAPPAPPPPPPPAVAEPSPSPAEPGATPKKPVDKWKKLKTSLTVSAAFRGGLAARAAAASSPVATASPSSGSSANAHSSDVDVPLTHRPRGSDVIVEVHSLGTQTAHRAREADLCALFARKIFILRKSYAEKLRLLERQLQHKVAVVSARADAQKHTQEAFDRYQDAVLLQRLKERSLYESIALQSEPSDEMLLRSENAALRRMCEMQRRLIWDLQSDRLQGLIFHPDQHG
jgi:hypothetical protein